MAEIASGESEEARTTASAPREPSLAASVIQELHEVPPPSPPQQQGLPVGQQQRQRTADLDGLVNRLRASTPRSGSGGSCAGGAAPQEARRSYDDSADENSGDEEMKNIFVNSIISERDNSGLERTNSVRRLPSNRLPPQPQDLASDQGEAPSSSHHAKKSSAHFPGSAQQGPAAAATNTPLIPHRRIVYRLGDTYHPSMQPTMTTTTTPLAYATHIPTAANSRILPPQIPNTLVAAAAPPSPYGPLPTVPASLPALSRAMAVRAQPMLLPSQGSGPLIRRGPVGFGPIGLEEPHHPGTSSHHPDTSSHYPGTSSHYPGTSSHYPDTSSHYAGTSSHYPDTSSHYADTSPHQTDSKVHYLAATHHYPSNEARHPSAPHPSFASHHPAALHSGVLPAAHPSSSGAVGSHTTAQMPGDGPQPGSGSRFANATGTHFPLPSAAQKLITPRVMQRSHVAPAGMLHLLRTQ
eukprot:GHVU01133592.1.p1 GENE.GHVU01133592.1~~GHVU01133592.1.p1  ORF type:complete len:502 (+),score=60.00 GHVU01133592.1:111-1508(+)